MNIDELTLGEIKSLKGLLNGMPNGNTHCCHPMLNRRCLIRTYSAGVHIGTVVSIDETGMQVHLKDALRLWKWEDGGLSLSAVANNGIVKGRLNNNN